MNLFHKKSSFLLPVTLFVTSLLFATSITLLTTRAPEVLYSEFQNYTPTGDTIPSGKTQDPDSVFNRIVRLADIFQNEKKYEQCLTELEKASRLKPADQTIKERIKNVRDLLTNRDLQRESAKKSISSGDTYFNARDYLNAKSAYQLAVNQDPENSEAKEKLKKTVELLRSQKAQYILYDVAIASADKLFQAGEFSRAQAEYEKASSILPAEVYPKKKINEIIKILVDSQAKEDDYSRAITAADKMYQLKNYQAALIDYRKAGNVKPEEKYPQQRIKELTDILFKQKQLDDAYSKAIGLGDQQFTAKQYPESRSSYQEALAIKPNEIYPINRIKEIERILLDLKNKQQSYDKLITLADSLYILKDYGKARESYQNAVYIKPSESYPKEMISKVESMMSGVEAALARQKSLDEQYQSKITTADALFTEKSYEKARDEYRGALAIKPAEKYPGERIAEVDRILAEVAAKRTLEEKYTAAVTRGDQMMTSKNWDQARAEYVKASELKPEEQYPRTKIGEIEGIVKDLARQKELDEQYRLAIATGDKLFTAKTYDQAREEYRKASELKPQEQYPKDRIAAADKELEEISRKRALEDQYAGLIQSADRMLGEKRYEEARADYEKASAMKPSEKYPKEKIAEIGATLAELARQKSLDEQYQSKITTADALFTEKSYEKARDEYRGALAIKPAEKYPGERIAEVDRILAEVAAKRTLEEKYTAAVTRGDQMMTSKNWDQARAEYVKASELKPEEQYPRTKIGEIEGIVKDLARQKELDEQYRTAIAAGDKLFTAKTYDQAREEYRKASELKPQEQYPKDRMAAADKELEEISRKRALEDQYAGLIQSADRMLGEKRYEEARADYEKASAMKPSEKYPKEKIAEIGATLAELARQKSLDEQYQSKITTADALFTEKSYEKARDEYRGALAIKPAEKYPGERIAEVDRILAEVAAKRTLEEKYTAAVTRGDQMMTSKNWDQARAEYVKASELKPEEQYPRTKIGEIEGIVKDLARQKELDEQYRTAIAAGDKLFTAKTYDQAREEYRKASELKPQEQYPKDRMAAADKELEEISRKRALEDQYAGLIQSADRMLGEKRYEEARADYEKASAMKPSEKYPKEKIAEIGATLAELARQKSLDEQYQSKITTADALFTEKSYEKARDEYRGALAIKPAEKYPGERIAEVDRILAEVAAKRTLEEKYTAAVTRGDQMMTSKNWDQARAEYVKASELKPEEQYPRTKIGEIEGIVKDLARQKELDEQYRLAIATGDKLFTAKTYDQAREEYRKASELKPQEQYPKDRMAAADKAIEDLLGKQKVFENLLTEGDAFLTEKEYSRAKETFQKASAMFPENPYPKERLSLVNARIDSLYRANKSQYDKAIADGDRYYNTYEFDKAIDAYSDAANFLPMESYPREMVAKIKRTIAENAISDVLNTPVTITADNTRQFPFTPVNVAARKNNFVYIRIKNLSNKPFNVLMRYGKDKQPNGGVVIRNIPANGKINERLISVRDQDLWSREDNNWISLYPQGGDIEVSFIQVSRAK